MNVGSPIIKLAGVISGSFENRLSGQNQGIAALTPAWKLKELLFSEEVVAFQSMVLSYQDQVRHNSGFVTVNGIKLNYLDWGGKGEPLLFLSSFGVSPHVFDDLAPKFTDRFRVIGLARKGQAETSKPLQGYDSMTLVENIKSLLDFLTIKQVNIIGVGDSGNELTLFASLYPERVGKLVYMDAAYDHSKLSELLTKHPSPPQLPAENSIEKLFRDGLIAFSPDYTKIKNSSLSIFFTPNYLSMIPPNADENIRKQYLTFFEEVQERYRKGQIEKFQKEMANGKVREITIENFNAVGTQELRDFLLSK